MKRIFFSLSIIFSLVAQSQMVTDTVSMGTSYAQDVYYSVNSGEVATVDRDNWDLAFGTDLFDVSIHINETKGMELYEASTDVNDWATLDTTGMSWMPLHNSDTTWEWGAFNANADGDFNYGWGTYNTTTHKVYASAIYVIKLADGTLQKMIIDEMDLTGTYSFRIADLDGSNEVDTTLQKTLYSNKQRIYMDLSTYAVVDREPARDSWEMVFTKYMAPVAPGIYYPVTGVLTGEDIRSIRRADVPVSSDQYDTTQFENFISHIGYDWKSFDLQNMVYNCADSLTFFVEDRDFNVHKIYFTAFAGSSTGDITLERSASLNLSIEENMKEWNIFPVPASHTLNISGVDVIRYELINGMGQIVRTGSEDQIDVADLPEGIYFLRLTAAESVLTERVIIQ
jgi:hypothetical protein